MRRLPAVLAVGVAAALLVIGWAVTATGAPAAGTVQTFEVRIQESDFAINCGDRPQRVCFRRPRLASVGAGNGTVYADGRKVGTAIFANVTGKKLDKENTLDLFFANLVLDEGSTLSFQGATSEKPIPYSVTGGTGTYAGARGTVLDSDAPGATRGEFRITVTITFL